MSRVLILNSTGNTSTSTKHAEHYVAQGRARWIKAPKPTIRFIDDDHRHLSAARCVSQGAYGYDKMAHSGLATIEQIEGIPVVGDAMKLLYARS